MAITGGRKSIDEPYLKAFWFVAAQLGAPEATVGQVTGHSMREVWDSNRDIGQLLSFPYHDTRGEARMTVEATQALWERWKAEQGELATKPQITLNHFRLVIDPYMQHDHG